MDCHWRNLQESPQLAIDDAFPGDAFPSPTALVLPTVVDLGRRPSSLNCVWVPLPPMDSARH